MTKQKSDLNDKVLVEITDTKIQVAVVICEQIIAYENMYYLCCKALVSKIRAKKAGISPIQDNKNTTFEKLIFEFFNNVIGGDKDWLFNQAKVISALNNSSDGHIYKEYALNLFEKIKSLVSIIHSGKLDDLRIDEITKPLKRPREIEIFLSNPKIKELKIKAIISELESYTALYITIISLNNKGQNFQIIYNNKDITIKYFHDLWESSKNDAERYLNEEKEYFNKYQETKIIRNYILALIKKIKKLDDAIMKNKTEKIRDKDLEYLKRPIVVDVLMNDLSTKDESTVQEKKDETKTELKDIKKENYISLTGGEINNLLNELKVYSGESEHDTPEVGDMFVINMNDLTDVLGLNVIKIGYSAITILTYIGNNRFLEHYSMTVVNEFKHYENYKKYDECPLVIKSCNLINIEKLNRYELARVFDAIHGQDALYFESVINEYEKSCFKEMIEHCREIALRENENIKPSGR